METFFQMRTVNVRTNLLCILTFTSNDLDSCKFRSFYNRRGGRVLKFVLKNPSTIYKVPQNSHSTF
jgi:hypothetical protein